MQKSYNREIFITTITFEEMLSKCIIFFLFIKKYELCETEERQNLALNSNKIFKFIIDKTGTSKVALMH